MAYVHPNYRTKTELKKAVKAGKRVQVVSNSMFPAVENGTEHVEGPHYPAPHTWYAVVQVKNGYVEKVIS